MKESVNSGLRPFQELYYVAYYRGECVGVLYATFYKRRGKNDARAVIATLVVAKDKERCAGKIVAAELLERLKADTRADDCQRYFVEIPRLEELTRKQRDICLRGWRSLDKNFKIEVFPDLAYQSPDLREWHDIGEHYEAEPMHLLTVFGYPKQKMKRQIFDHDVLRFVYGVYHTEAIDAPFEIRNWINYLNELEEQVKEGLPATVSLTQITPSEIETELEGLETT